jgi:hypothetical protein
MELAMYRARRTAQPKVPSSAEEFATMMSDPAGHAFNENFKAAVSDGADLAVLFMSSIILPRLVNIRNVFYDGTFFCVPRMFYQCFTIMALFGDHCLPVIHVLMSGKSQTLYEAVVNKIREIAPGFMPTHFMGDYELASKNALSLAFPNATFVGCQFHFSQALWKKCQKLGLTDAYKSNPAFQILLKKLMVLPYLPAAEIQPMATSLLDGQLQVEEDTRTKLQKLRRYIFRFWISTIGAENVSVHNFDHGTNNFCESFHSRMKGIIRVHHPAIWSFMGHLNLMIKDTERDMERADAGLNLTRPRKRKFQDNMKRRAEAKLKFQNGEYDASQYLSAVSHTMDSNLVFLETMQARLDLGTEEEEVLDVQGQQIQSRDQGPVCSVCLMPRSRTFVLRPCNHASFCADCSAILEARGDSCPICRGTVEERFEIFPN